MPCTVQGALPCSDHLGHVPWSFVFALYLVLRRSQTWQQDRESTTLNSYNWIDVPLWSEWSWSSGSCVCVIICAHCDFATSWTPRRRFPRLPAPFQTSSASENHPLDSWPNVRGVLTAVQCLRQGTLQCWSVFPRVHYL